MSENRVTQTPPGHLEADTRKWLAGLLARFNLDEHCWRLAVAAGESWDVAARARRRLAKHGLTYTDRFGSPRARPEVKIANDSRLTFSKLIRQLGQLGLDVGEPEAPEKATAMAPRRANDRSWRAPSF